MRDRAAGIDRERKVRGHPRESLRRAATLPVGVRGARRHEPRRVAPAPRTRGERARIPSRPRNGPPRPTASQASPAAEALVNRRGTATRDYHPAKRSRRSRPPLPPPSPSSAKEGEGYLQLPRDAEQVELRLPGREVRLTNLNKLFWPELGLTKRDLLQYYASVAPALLPHLRDRAMVMKRYPHGASGEFFFMKRAPSPRPDWIEICSIEHASGNVIDFPMVQDLASLLWVVNLGCIDLNQWYARCDDVDRPDYLHFDLDPVPGATWIHVYVPIIRGPTQKQVWTFGKKFAQAMESRDPKLVTAEYKIAKRPEGRVLVDYNQNAWGRTLASIYSVRPKPRATVSTPVTWKEIEKGVAIEDFRMDNVPARVAKQGDLWKPLLSSEKRFRLETFF